MDLLNKVFLTVSSSPVPSESPIEEKVDMLQKGLNDFVEWAKGFAQTLVIAIIVFFIGKKLIHILMKLVKHALERANTDEGVSGFVVTLVKTVGYVVLFVMIAGLLGLETSSLVALVGSAGLTLGLALQGSLSNFAGGVLILINKPFRVGDYIVAGVNEGTVSKIDIFYTHIVTIDNKDIVLPNGSLSNMNVTNSTKEETRRLDLFMPVAYDSDIDHVRETLRGVCNADERILSDSTIEIYLYEFADSAINMTVRVWTRTEDYWPLKWSLQEEFKKALDREGIAIPFNQLDVNVVNVANK